MALNAHNQQCSNSDITTLTTAPSIPPAFSYRARINYFLLLLSRVWFKCRYGSFFWILMRTLRTKIGTKYENHFRNGFKCLRVIRSGGLLMYYSGLVETNQLEPSDYIISTFRLWKKKKTKVQPSVVGRIWCRMWNKDMPLQNIQDRQMMPWSC